LRDAADCERRLRELYHPRADDAPPAGARGLDGRLAAAGGVIHVVAAGRRHDGSLGVIAIGTRSPRSETDRFLLGVARARADAIVTTGRILRAEPDVTHALGASSEETAALAEWRRCIAGKAEPPLSAVLTGGGAVDLSHPLLRTAPRPLIVTGRETARDLASAARAAGIEVVARDRPGLRDVVAFLRAERSCTTVTVETGPSTARELYQPPLVIDEVMLSIFEEQPLALDFDAGTLPDERRLEALFPAQSPRHTLVEASGRWSFRRFRRD
jgi:riboflavin biosynthesis pyrimidine reductase